MKELKGQNARFAWHFLGFGGVETGISADRLNLLRSQDGAYAVLRC